ncbi:RlpA-like double-psi beta-barrel-protein domain-containing protein-containing protein [Kalaharituber pfeilii]|nr:RlpA-like double-psi beta-barrel-protein domain-containing protein-containing protein [Kalaharituber pfeilii]
MARATFLTVLLASVAGLVSAQQSAYGQCGGIGWSGPTTCVRGYTCVFSNPYYSQCLPGSAATSPTTRPTSTSSAAGGGPTSPAISGPSGSGKTTRYWDCCKPSCAWEGKAPVTHPVNTCNANNQVLTDFSVKSGCDGGTAFMCSNQIPWAVSNSLAYGYAAVRINGLTERDWCCSCYELTFTSGPASGKRMVVQATNTGGDLGDNHFDIALPGGGVGIFNGCTKQYNAPADGWGQRYGGVSSRAECNALPEAIRAGCYWRFDWFGNSDNPSVTFKTVSCPDALTANTGCRRL